MSIGNFMCAGAVLATFGVVSMCCAFWCGVAVGRRDGARTLEGCRADVPADGGVSVDFKGRL